MKTVRFALLFTISVSVTSLYAGGGWVNPKGKGFFKLGQNFIKADKYYGPAGKTVDIPTIGLYTTSIYAEYGLSDRWDAMLYLPFFVRSTLNEIQFNQSGNTLPGDAINAFGDTDIGVKYGFFQDKPVVMSASLTLGLPTGQSEISSERILQTGDGEFNQLVKVEASYSYSFAWVSGAAGLNNRTRGFSDEYHFGFEVGVSPFEFLTLIWKTYSVNSFYNGTADDTQGSSVFSNNIEYFAHGPELIVSLGKFGLTATRQSVFSARRILAAPNYGVGIFYKP